MRRVARDLFDRVICAECETGCAQRQHKRLGDLLLANISTAVRSSNKVTLKDYYSADAPEISLMLDENVSLLEEAARYFARRWKPH